MKVIYSNGSVGECAPEEELHILRHTAAHIMAQAIKRLWPEAKFAYGPATDKGFYYDVDLGDVKLTDEDLQKIEGLKRRTRVSFPGGAAFPLCGRTTALRPLGVNAPVGEYLLAQQLVSVAGIVSVVVAVLQGSLAQHTDLVEMCAGIAGDDPLPVKVIHHIDQFAFRQTVFPAKAS